MNAPPEIKAEIQRWVNKAENDFRNAEYVLTLEENCPFDTVAYHCQQCAEKYLKAVLIWRGVEFPRTHDLVVLFNLLQKTEPLPLRVENVQPLNRYSIEARYPGNWEPIDEGEARAAFEMVKRIREAVRARLLPVVTATPDTRCSSGCDLSPTEGPDMNGPPPRFWPIFFEVFEALPRQGPGNRTCAVKALALCRDLPPAPVVLDLGCGVGGQTLHLAGLTSGTIVAVDSHVPSIERLRAAVAELGLTKRVSLVVGDMANLGLSPASFDLVWSEGALYNIGIENALRVCHKLLRPGGYLAFTDAVWRKENPPPEVKASFDLDYPTMGRVPDVLAAIESCGFSLISHFTLPDEAWWDDFYTPMQSRIEELRGRYAGDGEALAVLDQLAQEPEMHKRHSDYYAYEFFVVRRVE